MARTFNGKDESWTFFLSETHLRICRQPLSIWARRLLLSQKTPKLSWQPAVWCSHIRYCEDKYKYKDNDNYKNNKEKGKDKQKQRQGQVYQTIIFYLTFMISCVRKDYDVALAKYKVAAQSVPESPPLWNNIGPYHLFSSSSQSKSSSPGQPWAGWA